MSNLQIGLAIAGGLVLAGVVAHSAWSSRKNAPRQADPVLEDASADPGPTEPVLEPTAPDLVSMSLPAPQRKPALDPLIDVIAHLALEPGVEVSGDAAIAALPATRRAGSKPFAVEGLRLTAPETSATPSGTSSAVWEPPQPGARYTAFQAGVQLANRSGPLNEIEYSEFVVKTHAFADAVGATPEFPEMLDEVARARELDQFASAHDAQLGLTLYASQASWSPGFVHQCAARQGFVAGAIPGRMVLPASREGMPPVLVLSFDAQAVLAEDPAQSAIRQLSLQLDVAQVERAESPFVRLRETAFALAREMDGVVTDDNGQAIAPQTLDVIGGELEALYETLEQREFAPGSLLARRLFS